MAPAPKKTSAPKVTKTKSPGIELVDKPSTAVPAATVEGTSERSVKLTIKAQSGVAVFVAGSFNDWDPTSVPMTERKGIYSATLKLAPGIYEYKFVIDGVWTLDPDPARDWTQNGLGTLNSLLRVG